MFALHTRARAHPHCQVEHKARPILDPSSVFRAVHQYHSLSPDDPAAPALELRPREPPAAHRRRMTPARLGRPGPGRCCGRCHAIQTRLDHLLSWPLAGTLGEPGVPALPREVRVVVRTGTCIHSHVPPQLVRAAMLSVDMLNNYVQRSRWLPIDPASFVSLYWL
ncbi:hypothetical protein GQ53DRAFT_240611 [Thozetella sp. PMI_491]|nr:hypothetical protein GQ53DRAFT_240611 [Thozetella sp. PMI_491]